MNKFYGIILSLMVLFAAGTDAGAVLYGVDRNSSLYTIDPATGAATLIGPLGFGQASAFAINPANGQAFASPGGGGCCPQPISGCLYGVNMTTGAATQIGCDPLVEGLDPFSDLAFHSNGTLYGIRLASNAAPGDGNMYLSTLDQATGAVTDVGMITNWCVGHSLAFMPGDVLYTWDDCDGLSSVNIATGAPTVIGFGSYLGFPSDISNDDPRIPAMSAENGVLYGIVVTDTLGYFLASINTTTGDVTYISTLPDNMQNIAFYPSVTITSVPTITQWGLLIFIAVAGIVSGYQVLKQNKAAI